MADKNVCPPGRQECLPHTDRHVRLSNRFIPILLPVLALLLLCLPGCVKDVQRSGFGGGSHVTIQQQPTDIQPPPNSGEPFEDVDACAGRLQDIEGQFLEYYRVNHRLPQSLAELRQYAYFDPDTNYTCPVSHQPYVFVPGGLVAPRETWRLLMYDAQPIHRSQRNGILMSEPRGNMTPEFRVGKLPDALFRRYAPPPANQLPQPATAPGVH